MAQQRNGNVLRGNTATGEGNAEQGSAANGFGMALHRMAARRNGEAE